MSLFHDRWPWRKTADGRTILDILPRWLRFALGSVLILGALGGLMVWTAKHHPEIWHVDPFAAERTGRPNDHLVAPAGTTAAEPDRLLPRLGEAPAALMARLDAAMREEPRVEVVAGSPSDGHVTYVQRSALIGFPDYVSVRAVAAGGGTAEGTALAIWSRSRYGYSDMGVNAARVGRLLERLGLEAASR